MKIGIVGARLSGSYEALLLARMGHEVELFDHTTAKEKPCGGGVTSKGLRTIAWFREHDIPHTRIDRVEMSTVDGESAVLPLEHPIHVFSRFTLDSALRDEACAHGVRFIPERAVGFHSTAGSWVVRTTRSEYEFDFLVGADGAASSVRTALGNRYSSAELSLSLGFYVPGRYHPSRVRAVFQENAFRGYIWAFPRVDHCSVGILRWLPETNAAELRRRVWQFIQAEYPERAAESRFYAARIPCLSARSLVSQRVCGRNWALLGDAAGFADAITAEGIYFSLRSAELFARSFERGNPLQYEQSWRGEFGSDLHQAALWRDRFYAGTFLFRMFTRRALQAVRYSPTVRRLTDSVISGQTGYLALRRALILHSPRILIETLRSRILPSSQGDTMEQEESPS